MLAIVVTIAALRGGVGFVRVWPLCPIISAEHKEANAKLQIRAAV